jgi:hypothetical protein
VIDVNASCRHDGRTSAQAGSCIFRCVIRCEDLLKKIALALVLVALAALPFADGMAGTQTSAATSSAAR